MNFLLGSGSSFLLRAADIIGNHCSESMDSFETFSTILLRVILGSYLLPCDIIRYIGDFAKVLNPDLKI